jgi:hypothetical protein
MNRVTYGVLLAVLLIGTVFVDVSFAADHQHATAGEKLMIGKQGTVSLSTDTKFGDTVLKPGEYVVQHAVEGEGHIFTFVNVATYTSTQAENPSSTGNAYAAKCSIEPLQAKVRRTTVTTVPDGAGRRITRIEIKGETVAHVF